MPTTSAGLNRLLFFLFLLQLLTVLMKQKRQTVHAIQQSILLRCLWFEASGNNKRQISFFDLNNLVRQDTDRITSICVTSPKVAKARSAKCVKSDALVVNFTYTDKRFDK